MVLYRQQDSIEVLCEIGFNDEEVDPCLFGKGVVFVAIHVDDNLFVGYPKAIEDTIEQLKKNVFVSSG